MPISPASIRRLQGPVESHRGSVENGHAVQARTYPVYGFVEFKGVGGSLATVVVLALIALVWSLTVSPASGSTVSHSAPSPILVEWNDDSTSVWISAKKELSNVVLMDCLGVQYHYEEVDAQSGQFRHPAGLSITTVWVQSGNNHSGDGPGYGERFDNPDHHETCGIACEFTDGCDPMPRRDTQRSAA